MFARSFESKGNSINAHGPSKLGLKLVFESWGVGTSYELGFACVCWERRKGKILVILINIQKVFSIWARFFTFEIR